MIAHVLLLLLFLSLCACAAENPYAKYEHIFQMLESRGYDGAIDAIAQMAGPKPVEPATEEPTQAPTDPTPPPTEAEPTDEEWEQLQLYATILTDSHNNDFSVFTGLYCLQLPR